MSKKNQPLGLPLVATVLALCLGATPLASNAQAQAQEREDLEKLRATVVGLLEVLIRSGILPRDRVDALMREAEKQANTRLAAAPPPEIGPDGKKVVRVPYVPDAVKTQMRDEIKTAVLAQARTEGWGSGSPSIAETGTKIQIEGDLRLRAEAIRPSESNSPASIYATDSPNLTRAPDIWDTGPFGSRAINTQESLERTRVRARLGLNMGVTEGVTVGLGLSTGNTTGPTSTNQTMGQGTASSAGGYFNKYSLVLDKAFLRYEPWSFLSFSGGRFRNPFMGTDLVWADDLNFEGFALNAKPGRFADMDTFVNAGWFPLSFDVPRQSSARSLFGIQGGVNWQFGTKANRLKLGVALYEYSGVEGVKETTADANTVPAYGVRSEYGSGYRQRGNTLFRVNSSADTLTTTNYWGLASGFRELDITAVADIAVFDPVHIILTGDIVQNLKFKRGEASARAGQTITDGSGLGYLFKVQVGAPTIAKLGDWNAAFTYRRLGSDAVIDAFTNSDFGLGGTNNRGIVLAGSYGLARNTWVTGRWMSSELINSAVPASPTTNTQTKYSIDTFQVELNARY